MGKIQKLAGQTLVYGLGTMIPRFLNFAILTPYYTNIFDKAEYGIITELYAYIVVLQIMLTYGMETGYFRLSEENQFKRSIYANIQSLVGLTSIIFFCITLICHHKIAGIIGYEGKENFIIWFCAIVSIDAFTAIPFAKLRKQNKALRFTIIKLVNVVSVILFVFLFISILPEYSEGSTFSWLKKFNRVEFVFIANLLSSIITLILLIPEIANEKVRFESFIIKPLFIYSIPVLIAGLGGSLNEALDRIVLKHLISNSEYAMEQLGIYGANYKLAVLITLFIQMFRYASEPFFFANMKENNAKETYARVLKYFIIVCIFLFLFVNVFMDYFKYFIGKQFHEGLKIVPIILMANVLIGIYFNVSIWFKINKKTILGALLMVLGAIITIVGNIVLIPKYGYVGAAWTHLICYVTIVVLCIILGNIYYPIKYEWGKISSLIILGMGLFFLFKYLEALWESKIFLGFMILILYFITVVLIDKELRNVLKNKLIYDKS